MSQNNGKEKNKDTGQDNPGNDGNKGFPNFSGGGKKSKFNFNFYWIYGIIAVLFFAMQFLNWGSGAVLTTWEKFENEMLRKQEVERIVVVNNEKVEIYIRRENLTDAKSKIFNKAKEIGVCPGGMSICFNFTAIHIFPARLLYPG